MTSRTRWFRFWVWVSERLVKAEYAVLRGPRTRFDAEARIRFTFGLAWLYHRCLDLAALGLTRAVCHCCPETDGGKGHCGHTDCCWEAASRTDGQRQQ